MKELKRILNDLRHKTNYHSKETVNVDLDGAIKILEEYQEWQPIETAPRDENILLHGGQNVLFDESGREQPYWVGNRVVIGYYTPDVQMPNLVWHIHNWSNCEVAYMRNPTHWQPLPKPPIDEAKDE